MPEAERGYIGLGANVGDALATLAAAVAAIDALPGVRVRAVSPLYRTAPIGVVDQPPFLNAVAAVDVRVEGDAAAAALALLAGLKAIERRSGRVRRSRWGPRELDLDVLIVGDARLRVAPGDAAAAAVPGAAGIDATATGLLLEVPHRSMADRRFVLEPLADLAPDLVPPGWAQTVAAAARRLAAARPEDAVERVAAWDPAAGAWAADAAGADA